MGTTTDRPLSWAIFVFMLHFISFTANLVTALAYFWIPLQGFLYLSQNGLRLEQMNRRVSLLIRLYIAFIFWCGAHHLYMAAAIATTTNIHGNHVFHLFIDCSMAFVSVWAAALSRRTMLEIGAKLND